MDLNELMKGCRTYRRFLQEPVDETVIRECLENARTASSVVVPVPEDGDLKYYVDEDRNYYVPKRAFDEVVRFA